MTILHLNDQTWIEVNESVEQIYKLIKANKFEGFIKVNASGLTCEGYLFEKSGFNKRYIQAKRIIEIY